MYVSLLVECINVCILLLSVGVFDCIMILCRFVSIGGNIGGIGGGGNGGGGNGGGGNGGIDYYDYYYDFQLIIGRKKRSID